MDLLIDSHVALWWADDPSLLSTPAMEAIADPVNVVWLSAASAWELAIKVRGGKLDIDVLATITKLSQNGVRLLGIGVDDAVAAGLLDWDHRDPFDRMLVAQSQRLGLRLVTRDAAMLRYLQRNALVA